MEKTQEQNSDSIFLKLFKVAEIANLSPEEKIEYEESLKSYNDLKNSMGTSDEEDEDEVIGLQEGESINLQETVLNMIKTGFDNISIQNATNFSISEIEKIRAELSMKL